MAIGSSLTQATSILTQYVDLTDRYAVTAELLDKGKEIFGSSLGPENGSIDKNIEDLAKKVHEIVEGGILISELKKLLDESLSGDSTVADKIRAFIRITEPGDNLSVKRSAADRTTACYLNDIINYDTDIGPYLETTTELNLASGGIRELREEGSNKPFTISNLYAVELLNPRLGLASRDTPGVGIFTSLIPNVEMSRCTPYVNIRITTTGSLPSSEGEKQVYQGISLMSFLNGQYEKSPGNGLDNFLSFENGNGAIIPAGMEVFTSPQTLVPTRDSAVFRESNRGGVNSVNNIQPVADRFRPFMTLKSINFNVTPTKGMMSYKTAKIELVLHDRSRLGEIASLVKPGLYSETDFKIEYGWSHPAGNRIDKNPIGVFLNSQRVIETYTVINSSFSFEESGQVNVSLSLAMKGNDNIVSTDISECGASNAAKEIEKTLQAITEQINKARGKDSKRFESLFGDVVVNSVTSTSAALSLNEEKLKELRDTINKIKQNNTGPEAELAKNLDELFNETDGKLANFQKSAADAIADELFTLEWGTEIFPFHDDQLKAPRFVGNTISLYENLEDGITSETLTSPISLGRILLSFVGKPLAKSGKYEEVQFIFHAFNDKAMFMRDLSIAKFPIDYSELKEEVTNLMKTNTTISITQFINTLNSRFMGNMGAKAYGLSFLYSVDENGNPKNKSSTSEGATSKEQISKQYKKQDRIVKEAGINDGIFKLPKICLYPECVPVKSEPAKSILRLHVIDEQCATFSTLADLLRASNSFDLSSFGFTNDSEHPTLKSAPELRQIAQEREEIIKKLKDDKIIKGFKETTQEDPNNKKPAEPAVELEIDSGALLEGRSISSTKKFISRGYPTIYYGKEGGTIKSIGLQSLSDPALSTVNIMRMSKKDSNTPDLTSQRGLPMQVAPTQCSIEMLGCPLLSYGQSFFIDFGTGTTADNLYFVTGIDHKLEPGSFTTSVKLTFADAFGKYVSQNQKITTKSEEIRRALGTSG